MTGLGSRRLHLHIQHVEPWHTIVADISAAPFGMHIAACAKCLVARTRQQHHAHVLTRATVVKSTAHLPCGERCECVAIALAVDGDFGNAVKVLKQNFFKVETLNGLPFSLTHLYFSFKSFMRNAMACLQ